MKVFAAALAFAALCSAAAAETEEAPPQFTVIEADAKLPFAQTAVSGFQVARDNSLILEAGPGRWYRATVAEPCARDLLWAMGGVDLDTFPHGTLDRLGAVVVRGQRCQILTLDQIERPERGATK